MSKRFTTEEWIEACRAKRQDFDDYDFSRVEYVNARTKVLIIHKGYRNLHWWVYPDNFKNKKVCHPILTGHYIYTFEQWFSEVRKVRDDLDDYDFSKVKFIDTTTKILIIHKLFPNYDWSVTPNAFKHRKVCHPMLMKNYRYTTEQWLSEVRKVRNDFDDYDFSMVEYKNTRTKVLIRHKQYPNYDWWVSPVSFKDHKSCLPLLNPTGWSRTEFKNLCIKNNNGKGFLYLIYFICEKSEEEFCKIGITSRSIKERFCNAQYNHLKIKKTVLLEQEPALIYDLENEILREYRQYKFTPEISFDGRTECFTSNAWPIILKEKLSQYLIT